MSKIVPSTQHLPHLVLGGHRVEAAGRREGLGWCHCRGWGRQLSQGHVQEGFNTQLKMCELGCVNSCLHLVN